MAQKKITDLTLRANADDTCIYPADDTAQTWRVTGAQIKAWIKAALAPITTGGDMLTCDPAGVPVRVANGSIRQVWRSGGGTALPYWSDGFSQGYEISNLSLAASVGSSALTVAVKDKAGADPSTTSPALVGFRNVTPATGTFLQRAITAALSLTIPSSATLGHLSAANEYIYVYLIDNAGVPELAVSSAIFGEHSVQSSTTISGSATSKTVLYSATGRTNVPVRLVGRLKSNQTTAGTYAAVPSEISVGLLAKPQPRHSSICDTPNGYASTNNKIRKYTNNVTVGTAITYTSSATLGDSFTINEDGLYSLYLCDISSSGTGSMGLSLNSNQLTTTIASITAANILAISTTVAATVQNSLSITRRFVVGDVIRPHSGTSLDGTLAYLRMEIVKVSD